MNTATQELKLIASQAECIKSNETQRFSEAAPFDSTWRQGDIYITLLEKIPKEFTQCKFEAQLAPGTTKGSRHILSDEVTMYKNPKADALTGPLFKNSDEVTVTHPEHGNVVLPPGIYGVTYQRAFAEELRRVED